MTIAEKYYEQWSCDNTEELIDEILYLEYSKIVAEGELYMILEFIDKSKLKVTAGWLELIKDG